MSDIDMLQVTTKGVKHIARGCPNLAVLNLYHCSRVQVRFDFRFPQIWLVRINATLRFCLAEVSIGSSSISLSMRGSSSSCLQVATYGTVAGQPRNVAESRPVPMLF